MMSAHTLCAEVHAASDSTMKPKIVSIILSIAAVAWLPLHANAYCIGWDKSLPNYDPNYYSISHEYRRSKYVVKARVVRETWLGLDGEPRTLEPPFQYKAPRPWGFDPYIGAFSPFLNGRNDRLRRRRWVGSTRWRSPPPPRAPPGPNAVIEPGSCDFH
jgi:hypothetical protein